MRCTKATIVPELDDTTIEPPIAFFRVLLPSAVTIVHETKFKRGQHSGKSMEEVLKAGGEIKLADVDAHISQTAAFSFAIVTLREMGFLKGEGNDESAMRATPQGIKVLHNGGFAELILSYYVAFQYLYELNLGVLKYGLGKDIFRDGVLNARASNGITRQRVGPYITSSLDSVPQLSQLKEAGAAYLDYGSGGGDMLVQAAARVQRLFGIDVNPDANKTSQQYIDEAGLGERITLTTGRILDKEALLALREKMDAGGANGVIASINAILHDVGSEAAEKFLRIHAEVFGDAPLIITEILRIPADVVQKNPHRRTAAFQYMHGISGQHLYYEEELRALLKKCSYEIIQEKTHTSMPGLAAESRLPVDVTWIVQKQI